MEERFLRQWTDRGWFINRTMPRMSLWSDTDSIIHIASVADTCSEPCGAMIGVVRCTWANDVRGSKLISTMILLMSSVWSHRGGILSPTFLCLSPVFWCVITWWSWTARIQLHDILILSFIASSWQIQNDRSLVRKTVGSFAAVIIIFKHRCIPDPW